MDVERATREFFAALREGPAEAVLALLAPDAQFDAEGLPTLGRSKADAMIRQALARGTLSGLRVVSVVARRNVALAGWEVAGLPFGGLALAGIMTITWGRDGLVHHLAVRLEDGARPGAS